MPDPDYLYDPDDWEYTYNWVDRLSLTEDCDELRDPGDVKRFNTIIEVPPKFAAEIALTFDEAGDPDLTEIRWFDSEADARAACALPAPAER